ncbi:flagellar assembly peptidoglycan hydrolase FlgJ [Pseudomonas sp. ZM23]|uniref:Peptidoglycan hydrolase FlgJ n=1 Tax=Pseudomonas triclosanedens TaxID=2961893 RepID=A0ABY7A339_9PSED|nr:flagellar assembly peptidoglycan hydrolase FlgJ [Pseudomonas triclosanedens]MCP8464844.1 flagellar assembly peptidoglycan hydrolase FlgJ [Pseudomonas triclosanedens]MCP8470443.1 flagellar assembly peptidoglycan hydrolase FlgJ [Pseudomonas triclosanedens]MCP8476249.1 flagellar assembly peptidoglycan hydrolase FlgJ [Pseudomonas triclosanedens]WAI51518.1 flagellar assembly peptidoglycan hydrolase FlgJ [Pseudomonas triclosanedens]
MDAKLLSAGTSGTNSGAYTDLNRLAQLKSGAGRDSQANIRKVAQEFESLFMNEMLKSMRSANDVLAEGNYMNSSTTKQYQEMYDQQLSVSLSTKGHGIGLSDVMTRQLSQMNGGKRAGASNPFANVAGANSKLHSTSTWPSTSGVNASGKALPQPQEGRDDSKLLNARRLALPGKLADRVMAGIVPGAATAPERGSPLAGNDWQTARSYASAVDAIDAAAGAQDVSGRRYAQPPLAPGKSAFASADEFVATMMPMAQKAADRIGVDPRYLVAQAALETGWGKSIIRDQDGSSSHNLFGIKAGSSWGGDSARALTSEYENGKKVKEVAAFRSYDSFEQSFNDYVSFLQNNDRYSDALGSTERPEQFMKELQRAGYATDPNYARKVAQIAKQMQVYQAVAAADTPPLG